MTFLASSSPCMSFFAAAASLITLLFSAIIDWHSSTSSYSYRCWNGHVDTHAHINPHLNTPTGKHTHCVCLTDSYQMEGECISVNTYMYVDYFNLSGESDRPISSEPEMQMAWANSKQPQFVTSTLLSGLHYKVLYNSKAKRVFMCQSISFFIITTAYYPTETVIS